MSRRSFGNYSKKDYFEVDEDEEDYRFPITSSNHNQNKQQNTSTINSSSTISTTNPSSIIDDDIDPLDAFMAQNTEQIKQENIQIQQKPADHMLPEIVSGHDDLDDDDDEISQHSDDVFDPSRPKNDIEYDSDGVPTRGGSGKSRIEPLAQIDHSKIKYLPFKKSFYTPSQTINEMTEQAVEEYKRDLEINTIGSRVPRPIRSFLEAGFPTQLLREIVKYGFEAPTPIQSQALPVVLSGRDLIGLAQTGSGKTFSFIWPMIIHILDQPQMQIGDGPIGLILAPTRELAVQIHNEAKKFTQIFNIRICAVYGGEGKWQMSQALKEVPEIVIATPGRLIDLITSNATNLRRCTMVVLDEADRMFEMGFEYQMKSIVNNIRPDRQMLLFSATMKRKIESFAREIIRDPVRIVIGGIGHANPDIQQIVDIVPDDKDKWSWLACRLNECVTAGKVLIFVNGRADVESLASDIVRFFTMRQQSIGVEYLHGEINQSERLNIIRRFKSGECVVLVATDVASRGLDIKDIRTVINYQVPKDIDTHIHRIGRTGRMGVDGITPGVAYTLIANKSPQDRSFTVSLVKSLQDSGQESSITPSLLALAQSDPQWRFMMTNRNEKSHKSNYHDKGLGLGLTSRQAMTSSMLANQTPRRQSEEVEEVRVSRNEGVQKAYSKIMGDIGIGGAGTGTGTEGRPISQEKEIKKRKSRFSSVAEGLQENDQQQTSSSTPLVSAPPPTSQPSLPGFVRSSNLSSSIPSNNSSAQSIATNNKKSRWG